MYMTSNSRKGLVFIVSAPSGGGKSSLTRALLKFNPTLQLSTSTTTRPQRSNEIDGVHYHFKTEKEFLQLIEQNLLLEYAIIYGYYYGTLKQPVEAILNNGLDILFDIDWQGTSAIKQIFLENTTSIFILPPSLEILKQRLKQRGQDSDNVITKRLQSAVAEMKFGKYYDYVITNDNFEITVQALNSVLIVEKLKHSKLSQLEALGII